MNMLLFDEAGIRANLLPFTFTRPVALVRTGIFTIAGKWPYYLPGTYSFSTEEYLTGKYTATVADENTFINGALCPDADVAEAIRGLKPGTALLQDEKVLAFAANRAQAETWLLNKTTAGYETLEYTAPVTLIDQPWEIFRKNGEQIRADFALITRERASANLADPHTRVYNLENIFIEEGASIKAAIINAEEGPVYIGRHAQVHEGAMIKGPFALCDHAHINMGGKIRGDSTVGPHSKVGGEISNSVIFGYSNKAHDGFLGNSVIGEWCNLGADTNNSNLKNNYGSIKLWSYAAEAFADTGLQFCGLMMGDHSKCGINTMFNTGTVVGVSANVFGSGFPPKFIPSFSWGGTSGAASFELQKALEVAERVMERRKVPLTTEDREVLKHIFELTTGFRNRENHGTDAI